MKSFLALAAGALLLASPAIAQQGMALKSETFVVKQVTDAAGNKKNDLKPADVVLPGDVLVFVVSWKNNTGKSVTGFVVNNPIPPNTAFTGARDPQPVVSVDGGKTFGALATLKVKGADGALRAALPTDVQSLRWTLTQAVAPGASGNVAFFAVVK